VRGAAFCYQLVFQPIGDGRADLANSVSLFPASFAGHLWGHYSVDLGPYADQLDQYTFPTNGVRYVRYMQWGVWSAIFRPHDGGNDDTRIWMFAEPYASILTGDHWFWDASHPYLSAAQLFQFYLNTVGRGSNWILNVPPDRTGAVPANFAAEMAKLGAALAASGLASGPNSSSPVAQASQAQATSCAASEVVLAIPAGAVVDALELREVCGFS
jgi:hypothetical protein